MLFYLILCYSYMLYEIFVYYVNILYCITDYFMD